MNRTAKLFLIVLSIVLVLVMARQFGGVLWDALLRMHGKH
jgi:hypothetical protein